jgi:iron complex transport system ATP-binding protein
LITLRNIKSKIRNTTLFEAAEIQIQTGELISIVGKNGSGKSTLLKSMAGLNNLVSGQITLFNKDFRLNDNYFPSLWVSYIPVKINPFGAISLQDFILSGKTAGRSFMDIPSKNEQQQVFELLQQFNMHNMAFEAFEHLSDGEQKLALIMRSVYRNSEVLLLDEPESFLDVGNRKLVFEWLKNLSKQGKTIIFSTHQPDLAAKYVDRFLTIDNQQLNFKTPASVESWIELLYNNQTFEKNP